MVDDARRWGKDARYRLNAQLAGSEGDSRVYSVARRSEVVALRVCCAKAEIAEDTSFRAELRRVYMPRDRKVETCDSACRVDK